MPAYCFRQRTAGSPALRYSQTLQAPRPDCRLHPDSRLFRSLFCQRLPHSPDRRRMPVRSNLRRCCTLRFDTLHSRCCDFGAPPSADFPFPVLQILLRIIGVIIQLSTVFIAAGHILRRLILCLRHRTLRLFLQFGEIYNMLLFLLAFLMIAVHRNARHCHRRQYQNDRSCHDRFFSAVCAVFSACSFSSHHAHPFLFPVFRLSLSAIQPFYSDFFKSPGKNSSKISSAEAPCFASALA